MRKYVKKNNQARQNNNSLVIKEKKTFKYL